MKGEMRIMNVRGDEKVAWDTEIQETVDAAAAKFAELLLCGMIPISTSGETRKLDAFDPQEKRIVMIMPMIGG